MGTQPKAVSTPMVGGPEGSQRVVVAAQAFLEVTANRDNKTPQNVTIFALNMK